MRLALLVLALLGVGALAGAAGYEYGAAAHAVAVVPGPAYPAGPAYWGGGWGFAPFHFFGLFFGVLFIALLLRWAFFGHRRWHGGGWYGGWHGGPGWGPPVGGVPGGPPPHMDAMLREWHRRAHDAPESAPPGERVGPS